MEEQEGTSRSTDSGGNGNGGKKYYQPEAVRSRHLGIMDLMLACPNLTQNEIAERLGYTPSRLSIIVKSPLFQLAFQEYRRKLEGSLIDMITDATASAVKFSKEVVENENAPLALRQVSAKDILNQGHVKAAESIQVNRRSLNANVEIPFKELEGLKAVILEAKEPTALPSRVFRPAVNSSEVAGLTQASESSDSQT